MEPTTKTNSKTVEWWDERIKEHNKSTDLCFVCNKKVYTDQKWGFSGIPDTYYPGVRHIDCKKHESGEISKEVV